MKSEQGNAEDDGEQQKLQNECHCKRKLMVEVKNLIFMSKSPQSNVVKERVKDVFALFWVKIIYFCKKNCRTLIQFPHRR